MQRRERRRAVKTRDSREWNAAGAVTLIPIGLAAATVLSSPWTGLWTSRDLWVIGLAGAARVLWIVPANFPYFLTATLVSTVLAAFVLRWAIRAVRLRTAAGKSVEELQALSPDQFEEWVAARFRDLGYSVKLTGMYGDHGVDLVAERPGETAVVQCKNYKVRSVGEPILRDLFGAMHDFGAHRAYLVTTGYLSSPAANWVVGKPIEVWDGDYIARLSMQMATRGPQAKTERPRSNVPTSGTATEATNVGKVVSSNQAQEVAKDAMFKCPKCGSELVKRHNGRTREPFLGCSKYPACHYTQAWPVGKAP